MAEATNDVEMAGKISRREPLKYTPDGIPLLEFVLAVPQKILGRPSVGYFKALAHGTMAEELQPFVKIGKSLWVKGSLFSRAFRNTKGIQLNETKIVLKSYKKEGS